MKTLGIILLFTFQLMAQQFVISGKVVQIGMQENNFIRQFQNTDVLLQPFRADSLRIAYEIYTNKDTIKELGYVGFYNKKCTGITKIWGEFSLGDFFDFLYKNITLDDKNKCVLEFPDIYSRSLKGQSIIFRISDKHWIEGEPMQNSIDVSESILE